MKGVEWSVVVGVWGGGEKLGDFVLFVWCGVFLLFLFYCWVKSLWIDFLVKFW